jgi:hypothetical protein
LIHPQRQPGAQVINGFLPSPGNAQDMGHALGVEMMRQGLPEGFVLEAVVTIGEYKPPRVGVDPVPFE